MWKLSLAAEAAAWGVLWKKMFLGGLQLYSKRDSGTGVFLWISQNF